MIIIVQHLDMGNPRTKDNFNHYIREIHYTVIVCEEFASARKLGLSLPGFAFDIAKSGASPRKGNFMRHRRAIGTPIESCDSACIY